MTISTQTRKAGPYVGNGVATAFVFNFKVFAKTDLVVVRAAAGAETTLVLDSDYSVVLNGDQDNNPGGTVTCPISGTPLSAAQTLTIGSVVPDVQSADLQNLSGFYPQVIEDALDRRTIETQQISEKLGRTLRGPISDLAALADLPTAAARAGKFMAFDALGQPIVSTGGVTGVAVETVVQTVATIAALKAMTGMAANQQVVSLGYYAPGDGGGGNFYWSAASTATDNGGTTIIPNSAPVAGRWLRPLKRFVDIREFGAKVDAIADDAPPLRAAMAHLNSLGGGELKLAPGIHLLSSLTADANPYKCFSALYPNVCITGVPGASVLKAASGLSIANQWNFFVIRTGTSFDNIRVSGITFDFNGANNLVPAPPGTYRPCIAIWVIVNSTGVGRFVEVDHCIFKDNPGANSVSVIDDAPAAGVNAMEKVFIHHNTFLNFGYPVNNSANVNNQDHSCIYAACNELIISDNIFTQAFTVAEGVSIGMSAIDFHSQVAVVSNNICNNTHTFVTQQNNFHSAREVLISGNVCEDTDRLYVYFDSGTGSVLESLRISENIVGIRASARALPCVDLFSATLAETPFNVVIDGNQFNYKSGSLTGRNTPVVKVRRAENLQITNNHIWNAIGRAIHYVVNVATSNLFIKDNIIGSYGAGNVVGSKVGIEIDTTGAAGNNLRAYIENNIITSGATREAGIIFNGGLLELVVNNNDIIGATKKCTTSSFNVTNYYIRRGITTVSALLNFAAPGAVPGQVVQNVTVTGCALGDMARVSAPVAMPANYILAANVIAANTVAVQWTQIAGAAVDPDGGGGGFYQISVDLMQTD